jgi:hypothetical protein
MKDADAKNKPGKLFAPPGRPWRELAIPAEPAGYLSIYYSDDLSGLPVREVTRPGDNKSDPNVETQTYGMFSTCGRSLRAGIVERGHRYLFFATNRGGQRVLSGYYDLRWYAESSSKAERDYCLAARAARFVLKPIPLATVDRRCGTTTANPFRSFRRLKSDECLAVKALIDEMPDATGEYVKEIRRLERFNRFHGGYRYIGWKQDEEFSWGMAGKYLQKASTGAKKEKTVNSSPSDLWRCGACESVSANKSLLRACPDCGALATLEPIAEQERNLWR